MFAAAADCNVPCGRNADGFVDKNNLRPKTPTRVDAARIRTQRRPMVRWPDKFDDDQIACIEREWCRGTPAFRIAAMLGKTWRPTDVIAVAAREGFRRPWTVRDRSLS